MTILASFASAKHSPGATTACLAMAVAAARPTPTPGSRLSFRRGNVGTMAPVEGPPVLVVEADPMGGDLAARLERTEDGLERLAPAARHTIDDELVLAHSQRLRDGLHLLSIPLSDAAARAALTAVGSRLAEHLAHAGIPTLVDCGRLTVDSPALRFAEMSDQVLWVTRRTIEDAVHLKFRLDRFRAFAPSVVDRSSLLVVDEGDFGIGDLARTVGVQVFGTLPFEPRGVGVLHGRTGGSGTDLLSEARKLCKTWRDDRRPATAATTVEVTDGATDFVVDGAEESRT